MPNENLAPDYQQLLHVFNTIFPLSDELEKAIIQQSEIIHVKKKTLLLSAGEINNTIYFINAGAARVYYLNKEGVETTSWFLFENELLISVFKQG
jgi:CRP-like cAMP-binding protein